MGKIKLGRALGLAVLGVLGLMALFAGGAQAAAGEYWVGSLGSFLLATFTGAQEGTFTELVPGRNLSVNCAEGKIKGALETKTSAEAEITFSKCTALNHTTGTELLLCTVHEPFIITAKILPFLHEGKNYVTFEPLVAGGNFGTLVILGAECAIKGSYPIKGTISAEVTTNGAATNLITFSKAFSELVKDVFQFGAFPASWNGKYTLELNGAHAGKNFGVH